MCQQGFEEVWSPLEDEMSLEQSETRIPQSAQARAGIVDDQIILFTGWCNMQQQFVPGQPNPTVEDRNYLSLPIPVVGFDVYKGKNKE